jgi:mono/diheme cytochrome c family protein
LVKLFNYVYFVKLPCLVLKIYFLSALILLSGQSSQAASIQQVDITRGQYIFKASGCAGCHTDVKNKGPFIAGGRALVTPFGTFFGPNITPDKTYGIGKWSEKDFFQALRKGISPDGSHYFPVFPYTSFTKMTESDMRDLRAYIFSLDPVAKPNIPHQIKVPFQIRQSIYFWKLLFFYEGPFKQNLNETDEWNRGAYLSESLAHCGECHTPRNFLGALNRKKSMAGTSNGPDGRSVPNITPDLATGIGKWSQKEIVEMLKFGILPNGDFVGGAMSEVTDNMANLTDFDLQAIANYISSLPVIKNKVTSK